jgi:hypothetical protein
MELVEDDLAIRFRTCSRIEAMYVSHQSIVTAEMPPICSTVRVSQNPSRLVEVISRYNLFVRWFAVLAPPRLFW